MTSRLEFALRREEDRAAGGEESHGADTQRSHQGRRVRRRRCVVAAVRWCRANRCSPTACRRASCRCRSRRRSPFRRSPCRCAATPPPTTTACRCEPTPLEIVPGFQTMFFTYDGTVPGPTIKVNQGRQAVVRHMQHAAERPPDARLRAVDIGAPARLGVAAAVRRLRERHHPSRAVQGLPLPELPARANALVPRPRHPSHGRERVPRAGRPVPHVRPAGAGVADPARPATTCR